MIPNSKKIYLCRPDHSKINVLNGVQTNTVDFHPQVKGYSELSFTVDRFISINGNLVESNNYEDLRPHMWLYLEDIGYFIMEPPNTEYDGNKEQKQIVAYSAEKEFEYRDWVGIKINCGTSDSLEYANTDESNKDEYGFAVRYITMINQDPKLSFLDLLLEKMSSRWTIQYISPRLREAKIPWLEVDSENLYAVMTSEVGPRMSCLFVFDYLNFGINVFDKDDLDFDTGIYIGFRNLENNVGISVNNDSIYTRFTVQGDGEVNFRDVNFGDQTIMNLDYFLGEPYMDEETADKYRAWQEYRDKHREIYIRLAKKNLEYNDKLHDRKYKVPADQTYWKNWDSMSEEGLRENLAYFLQQLELLQISVDDRDNSIKYDSDGNYIPVLLEGSKPYNIKNLQWGKTYRIVANKNSTTALVVAVDDYLNTEIEASRAEISNCGYSTSIGSVFEYKPKTLDEQADNDYYLPKLKDMVNIYGGYHTYKEIITYIIPYIKMAIENIGKLDTDKQIPENESETDWSLYGYEELKGVRDSHLDELKVLALYSKDWGEMTEQERKDKGLNYLTEQDYEEVTGRVKYKKYKAELGDENTPGTILYQLKVLEAEIAQIEDDMAEINRATNAYARIMNYALSADELEDLEIDQTFIKQYAESAEEKTAVDNIKTERADSIYGERELLTIMSLLKDTDYVNSNIVVTSILSIDEQIDMERDLLADAADKITEVAQPQYTFSVSMDNFFRLPEYKEWAKEFEPDYGAPPIGMLKFIRVGLRDDYTVKLRVIGYRWNPCEVTPDLDIDFSNMITSRSGRSDLTELLDTENNRGSKNSIRIGNGSAESAQEYVSALMDLLKNNSVFLRSVQSIASGTPGAVDIGQVQSIISDFMSVYAPEVNGSVSINDIVGLSDEFENLFSQYVGADTIAAKVIESNEIFTNQMTINEILRIGRDGITEITSDTIKTATINATQIIGEKGDFDELSANIFEASYGEFEQLVAENSFIRNLQGETGEFYEFMATYLKAQNAEFDTVLAGHITADSIGARFAEIGEGHFDSLFANDAFINHLLTQTTATITQTVNSQYVNDLVANNITAASLFGGRIVLSDELQIVSENGALKMNGDVLQFGRKNGNDFDVGIQIGYGNDARPSLIIRDDNGTVLFTSQGIIGDNGEPVMKGISAEAIADGLIVNDMVGKGSLHLDRLNEPIVRANEYGGIDITQIYDGSGNEFGVTWTSFKNDVMSALDNVNTSVPVIELSGRQVFVERDGIIAPPEIDIFISTRNGAVMNNLTVDGKVAYQGETEEIKLNAKTIFGNKDCVVIKASSEDPSIYDTITLYKLVEGSPKYTVVISSSEGYLFKNETSTICTCDVYYGSEIVEPTSYEWIMLNDEEEQWQTVGNEKTLNIDIDNTAIKRRLKCRINI